MDEKVCACGHSEDEHGKIHDFPGSSECRNEECDCLSFDPVEG